MFGGAEGAVSYRGRGGPGFPHPCSLGFPRTLFLTSKLVCANYGGPPTLFQVKSMPVSIKVGMVGINICSVGNVSPLQYQIVYETLAGRTVWGQKAVPKAGAHYIEFPLYCLSGSVYYAFCVGCLLAVCTFRHCFMHWLP